MDNYPVFDYEKIAEHRHQLKMTQAQLADALGVNLWAVHRWEHGSFTPKTACVLKMMIMFNDTDPRNWLISKGEENE